MRLPELPGTVEHYRIPTRKEAAQIFNCDFFKREDLYTFLLKFAFTLMCEIWPRGGEELRSTTFDHFELKDAGMPYNGEDEPGERIDFDPNLLKQKTRAGDLSDFKKVFKIVTIFPNKSNPQFCFVRLFKELVDIRTRLNFHTKSLLLYIQQDKKSGQWSFVDRPIQIDVAKTLFQRICFQAGLPDYAEFKNHGVRAWMITEALAAGTQEHAVKDRSRHTSNTAVQAYKNASTIEQAALGSVMHNRTCGMSTTIDAARQSLCDNFENQPPPNMQLQKPVRHISERFPDFDDRRHFGQDLPPNVWPYACAQFDPRQHAGQPPAGPPDQGPPEFILPQPIPHHFPPPLPPAPHHYPIPHPAGHFPVAPLPPPAPEWNFQPEDMMVPNAPQMQNWNVGNNAVINVHYHHGPTISHISSNDRHVYNYSNAREAMRETGWAEMSPEDWNDFCE
ncbi:hypothetical protein CYMTET_12077 [Cymbomonas tetramitiformis]|uniref:Uncharacterized protein n=1 Tax=Cymbomonas tetramitiformis TaxID=36881 RepID=A0AAE0LCT4_9CHLO|nr:hypothetical protein CYMTET_12077 [Cymbomonas tetramitiformis]